MTKRMKIASIQMDVKFGQKRENYEKALVLLEEAKKRGADVALLPELWDLGFFPENNLSQMADLDGLEAKAFLSSCARKLDMNIVGGSVVNKRGKELYTAVLFLIEKVTSKLSTIRHTFFHLLMKISSSHQGIIYQHLCLVELSVASSFAMTYVFLNSLVALV